MGTSPSTHSQMHPFFYALIIAEVVWLCALIYHLKDRDLDPTDKICWTVVLCVLNVLGLFLFIMAGPKGKEGNGSERDLKRRINEGRL